MLKYSASDYFMVRTSLLSLSDYINMFSEMDDINERLTDLFNKPFMKEALTIASNDLSLAFANADLNKASKSSEQIKSSLIRYFIRLSTRPTPFGLFSGISVGRFGESSNIIVSNLAKHIKRARPDMEWIYGVIKKVESEPNIMKNLRVRFNDFTYAYGNRLEKPDKTFLQHAKSNNEVQEITSIRYTDQVKNIEKKSILFCVYSSITSALMSENPNITRERIDAFLLQLLKNEYLLSELRPPLTNIDVLDYIIDIFNKIKDVVEAEKYISKLVKVKKSISKFNSDDISEGIDTYNEIIQLMSEFFDCKNYLQVDMKIHTERNILDLNLKKELERFVVAMCKIAPYSKISDEMAHYKDLFLEKYGYDSEIPILELLDIDIGLGSPSHYGSNTIKRRTPKRTKIGNEERLDSLLNEKIITSLKEGKNAIEITDDDINFICGSEQIDIKHILDCPQSFELYLYAHTGLLGTDKEADYYFTVAPAVASSGIGKTFGRFRDLLTEEEASLLKYDFKKHKEFLSDFIIAEITEIPSKGRLSNVTINESDYDYQIVLSTNPNSDKHILYVQDLYIGIDRTSNWFYIRSKSLNKKVIITMTSMLNTSFSSSVLRFLHEVSFTHKVTPLSGIMLLLNSQFIYTPRITYGKIIIKPESWVVSKRILGFEKGNKSDFNDKIISYKERYNIPKYVFLNEIDNRLLLDLDNPSHREVVYNTLKTNDSKTVTLTEIGCRFDDYVAVNECDEHYVTEIVVPFMLDKDIYIQNIDRKKDAILSLSDISQNAMLLDRKDLTLLPGKDNWIYFKLYGCSKRKNELIVLIYEKLESLSSILQKYFFIRYADPEPHIRLRLRFNEDVFPELLTNITFWFESLRLDGLISKITIDSYQREVERYGGPELIGIAEDYFFHNSRLVMQIIKKMRYEKLQINLDVIGVSFIISVLEAFELKNENKKTFLYSMAGKDDYRKLFQDNRRILMQACDSTNRWYNISLIEPYAEVYTLLIESSKKLKDYANTVYKYDKKEELTNSIQGIIQSIIHMFCNRLSDDIYWEQRIYALTRHAYYAFQNYLKHQHLLF